MGDYNGKVVFGVKQPPPPRDRAGWLPNKRIADASRLFGPYIDVLFDSDFSLRKDPQSYEKMMRDCQIRSCIRLRQLTTAARKVEFLPRDESPMSQAAALFHTRAWNKVRRPTEVLLNILDAIPRGCSFNEIVWKPQEDDFTWQSENIVPVHKDRFRFTLDGEMVLVSPHDIFYGEQVPPRVFMHHKYDPEPTSFEEPEKEGRLYFGYGEFDRIWPWFHFKQLMLRLGFAYVDRLAFPIKVGRYPYRDGAAKAETQAFLQQLDHHRTALWPSDSGYDIDFLQTSATGHNVAMEWVLYFDSQITKVLLGSTLMQDPGDKGSFAMSAVHNKSVFGALTEADSVSLCDTLESNWGQWLCEMNSIPKCYNPKVTQSGGKSQDLDKVVDTMLLLSDRGFPVSVEQVAELTDIRPAREGETLLGLDLMNPEAGISVQNGGGNAPFGELPERTDGPQLQDAAAGKGPRSSFSFYNGNQKNCLTVDVLPEKSVKYDDVEGKKSSLYVPATDEQARRKLGVRKHAWVKRHAQNNCRIIFTYTNLKSETKQYDVEPYSYRYRRGNVYLYAFDPSDNTIKSFFAHKLSNIKRGKLFRPKWVVEIAETE